MKLTGWGRYPFIRASGGSFETESHLRQHLRNPENLLPHGLGRSYGDSALNDRVVFSRRFNKILDFDPQTGVVICESGVTLAELIEAFLPQGWFLRVTPGTKFITLGGAIASDVHGKNHHQIGCFSEGVLFFDLMLPDGQVIRCSREENSLLFRATCGGMGLTGVILRAASRLRPLKSAHIRQTIMRCPSLEEVFYQCEAHHHAPYSVAWIDCLSRNGHLGRAILMLGDHAETGHLQPANRKNFSIPLNLPAFCLNRFSISFFNHLYFQNTPDFRAGTLIHLEDFFYPLDRIRHWNRMYGRAGFTQYQLVLPKEASFAGLREILRRIAAAGLGSFLGVLKLFGPENDNFLSFPKAGYTLAVDIKIQKKLFPFLNELDRLVLDHGGRLYLSKDMRMSADTFRTGYPLWERFAEVREQYGLLGKFSSLQSRRLGV